MSISTTIYNDEIAVEGVKEPSRKKYLKVWCEFKERAVKSGEFEERMPTEDEFAEYFRYLRLEKKLSSSTLWTTYSILNAVVKGKYGERLQKHPRLTTLLKSFDTDIKKKAAVFEMEELGVFVASQELTTPYWLVRKGILILAFFGGLRHFEIMELVIEKFRAITDGVIVTHQRAKQRSDKKESNFLIPRSSTGTNYAAIIEEYLQIIKTELGKFTGRLLWTGKHSSFVSTPLGKNMVSAVPKEMARWLKKDNMNDFTFHSFRRTSATHAADSGATANQLMDFYGWANSKVAQECVSTSRSAVKNMAAKLIPATVTSEAAEAGISTTEGGSLLEGDKSSTPLFIGGANSEGAASKLITNNKQVFVIQHFSGNLNC